MDHLVPDIFAWTPSSRRLTPISQVSVYSGPSSHIPRRMRRKDLWDDDLHSNEEVHISQDRGAARKIPPENKNTPGQQG